MLAVTAFELFAATSSVFENVTSTLPNAGLILLMVLSFELGLTFPTFNGVDVDGFAPNAGFALIAVVKVAKVFVIEITESFKFLFCCTNA